MPLTKGRRIEVTPIQRGIIRDGIESLERALFACKRGWTAEVKAEIDELQGQIGEN